jgi:hypothetical protein
MSGKKPFFLTGANAKIKVNGRTIAFCTDIGYTVDVNHETPIVLGMYEGSSIEPLSYSVTGVFTVIRYAAGFKTDIDGADPGIVSDRGNGIGSWGPEGTVKKLVSAIDVNGADGRAYDDLNPRKLEAGVSFDIEISQKINEDNKVRSIANIRNCRITRADFRLSKRDVARQTFQFKALYVDEDSFIADFSGLGQQFA